MPNLFPIGDNIQAQGQETNTFSGVHFGKSWRFDFDKGEFVLTPTGKVAETDELEAWIEWCRKALITARYRYLIYSRNYGHEFDDLISRHLNKEGNESEIKRIVRETLMIDPRTASVENFKFRWEGDTVYFTCEVTNIRGESRTVGGQVVIA